MNPFRSRAGWRLLLVAAFGVSAHTVHAGDLKITLPKRSKPTPVQRLNQEGVDAVCKHQYAKANDLFYKAYLYDPDDPFTLNNLAYIAELNGQVDRSQHLYELAARHMTDAIIDRSSSPKLKGQSFREEVASIHDKDLQISRANVGAVHLLSQGHGSQAEVLLQRALAADSHNAFTLNNLGVAKEAEGDLKSALQYYLQAAATGSSQPVIVSFNGTWRGKPISKMAAESARRLSERINHETPQDQAAMLNLRGVAAINRNDWPAADKNFRAAYSLDPNNAFTLNNAGFVSEINGDLETAQFFYEKARQAQEAGARVGLATRRPAEGMKLFEVSDDNDKKTTEKITEDAEARRRQPGPIELKTRDHRPVTESPQSAIPPPEASPQSAPPPPSPASPPNVPQKP